MRLFLTIIMIMTTIPAFAQIEDDITDRDRNEITLKNDRTYRVGNGALTESFQVDDEHFLNIFDFENGILFHKDAQTRRVLEITHFKDLEKSRISEVKGYACYIIAKSGAITNKENEFFVKRHCRGAR